ncbi:MAG TPA: hypothetical protein VFT95_22650 [Micromonosporaceae bacterium]|nr:hypothetical protein [Micromonosporaceae bacterium]
MTPNLSRTGRLRRLFGAITVGAVVALVVGAPPAQAHHGGAHALLIYSLTCWAQNDPSGDDEPYIKINNDRIWSNPDCYPVHTYDLGGLRKEFWNEADLRVMEDDLGSDDTVLYLRIGSQAGQGVQTFTSYKWVGTTYIVNYQITYEIQ